MKWYFCLVPGLMAYLKRCAKNEKVQIEYWQNACTEAQNKHDTLLKELKRERLCTDFYADTNNWRFSIVNSHKASYICNGDYEWYDEHLQYIGGYKARQVIKKREVKL